MFTIYFALSAAAIFTTFGLEWPPEVRLYLNFFIGLSVRHYQDKEKQWFWDYVKDFMHSN